MRIERLQIEEGFLDGLDLTFGPGLNVIIGARGVGKTSVLELLRYALRLEHVDERRASASLRHAEAILGGGRVLVTFAVGETQRVVARSAADVVELGALLPPDEAPLVLGQSELEGIGLDHRSRLRLLDTHASLDRDGAANELGRLTAEVQSLTIQMRDLTLQRENLRQQELMRPLIVENLEVARSQERELLGGAGADAAALRDRLRAAASRSADLGRQVLVLEGLARSLGVVAEHMGAVDGAISSSEVDFALSGDPAVAYLGDLIGLKESQRAAASALAALLSRLSIDTQRLRKEVADIDDEVRPLRREFEAFQAGAAASSQATARWELQLAEIEINIEKAQNLDRRADSIRRERDAAMARIDAIRDQLWLLRDEAATSLSRRFEPRIRVEVEHYGDREAYEGELAAALRGSGLQYNQLAEWLAERMSPQELVDAVEAGDDARLAVMGELTTARVDKLISHLAQSESLGRVLTSRIDDLATFELRIGRDYKSSEELSTGQRCAVVLPLLLADASRTLFLDQPEDHLDNAYLVDNTIRTLLTRSKSAQTIVATHNANIPVLGDAGLIVCLESDGRRGYVRHVGPLTDPFVVEQISTLMEGGRQAFELRAAFYQRWAGDE